MNKEDAISRGVEVEEIKHSMKRRAKMHDYSNRGIYMLTLVVADRQPLLGVLHGEGGENGDPTAKAWVELSSLGDKIAREEVLKIQRVYPQVEVWKVCIMPDHLHIILFVNSDLPNGKHLGQVVRGFKTGCTRAWWALYPAGNATDTEQGSVPCVSPQGSNASHHGAKRPVLFEKGYNDKQKETDNP